MTKLDFSQAKVVQISGTAFSAMKVEANTRTKQQLEVEESTQQSLGTPTLLESSKVDNKNKSSNPNEQTVSFTDPISGYLVSLELSKENMNKLKQHFTDENNFHERKDGSIRLNGEAEAFVSGWFGDIAYKRGFLAADEDGDGRLNNSEFEKTKSTWNDGGEIHFGSGNTVSEVTANIHETYQDSKDTFSSVHSTLKVNSIEEAIQQTIEMNTNMDNNLSLFEIAQNSDYKKNVITYLQQTIGNKPTLGDGLDGIRTLLKKTDKEQNKQAKQALQKLRAANGDESVLSSDEKKALGAELQAVAKQLQKQSEKEEALSSVKDEIKDKVESTQFLDVKG